METKLSKVKALAAQGDWAGALRIAAKFQNLGDHRTAIKRAHEAATNPRFYAQLGMTSEQLMADGIAALTERYKLDTQKGNTMTTANVNETALTTKQVSQLTARIVGGGHKIYRTKADAITRFCDACRKLPRPIDPAVVLGASTPVEARQLVEAGVSSSAAATKAPATPAKPKAGKAAKLAAVSTGAAKRKAAMAVAEAAPAKPKTDKPAKPLGKRAQIEADAAAGTVPVTPDFSAPTHARYVGKLAEVVALVEAKDIDGLTGYELKVTGSSSKALDRYRNLAVIALTAQAKS